MFRAKTVSRDIVPSVAVAVVTGIWVYLISDNPVQLPLSLLIGLCCGIVSFFVVSDNRFDVIMVARNLRSKIVIAVLFVLLLFMFFVEPINSVFALDWFSLPLSNWLSFVLTFAFASFLSGFMVINLLGVYQKVSSLVGVALSVAVSLYLSSALWFVTRVLSLSYLESFGFFSVAQFVLIALYCLKRGQNRERKERRALSLNVLLPLVAIVIIFVSLVVLQELVYQPFVRGDGWDYVGTSMAIGKGAYDLTPIGKFYILSTPNFFETFLSLVTGLSGFPAVNSLLIMSLVVAGILPIAFYAMCRKYVENVKVSILSTFLFVIASGFGWIPFVSQKLASAASYPMEDLLSTLDILGPKVISDISQPQGVLSEGLKTYAFGLLAIILLLYLFRSNLPLRARIPLIAVICAFGFQFHVEEVLFFVLAFVPAYLVLTKDEKSSVRFNLLGLISGLCIALMFGLIASHGFAVLGSSFLTGVLCIVFLSVFLSFTFLKIDTFVVSIGRSLVKFRRVLFLICLYLFVIGVYVLVFYGYPSMTSEYSLAVVSQGLSLPWYYYPMSLGVIGILVLAGLLMSFHTNKGIRLFLLITILSIVVAVVLSFLNANVLSTGAKEWRIVYRMLPIPASVFGGWVLFKLLSFKANIKQVTVFKKSYRLKGYLRFLQTGLLLVVILIGIPSTLIASEYWMANGIGPHGDIHPQAADIELANYFYHIPVTSRAAVSSSDANAVIRLAGGSTAMAGTYLNVTGITRPETIALVSSDVRYFVLDKTQDSEQTVFLNYLPVVFNNSKYVVYRLPFLQSPVSESATGYVAPKSYDSNSLLSFTLFSSLNITYQIVNDNFCNKSVLILPFDFVQTRDNASEYVLNSKLALEWAAGGGKLVVFGGEGEIFSSLGLAANHSGENISINSIGMGSKTFSLNQSIKINAFTYDKDIFDVLSYYQLDGKNVLPFALQRQVGNGSIVYFYMDPLYYALNQSGSSELLGSDFLSNISTITFLGESSPNKPVWLTQYSSYAENSFWLDGAVTIQSSVSGSSFIQNGTKADNLELEHDVARRFSNLTIYSITADGQVDLSIQASKANSTGKYMVPNYLPIEISNSSISLKSTDNGLLRINTDKGAFVANEVSLESASALVTYYQPHVEVDGTAHFNQVSLPASGSPWSSDVNLIGKTSFHIGYCDSNYLFFDRSSYPSWQSTPPQAPVIPMGSILLSPFSITLVALLTMFYIVIRTKFLARK